MATKDYGLHSPQTATYSIWCVLVAVCYIQVAAVTDLVNSAEAVAVNFICNVLLVRKQISRGYHSYRIKCSCLGCHVPFLMKFTCLGKECVTLGTERAGIHLGASCHFPLCRLWVMFLWMWQRWSEYKQTCWRSLDLLRLWWRRGKTRHLCTLGP